MLCNSGCYVPDLKPVCIPLVYKLEPAFLTGSFQVFMCLLLCAVMKRSATLLASSCEQVLKQHLIQFLQGPHTFHYKP